MCQPAEAKAHTKAGHRILVFVLSYIHFFLDGHAIVKFRISKGHEHSSKQGCIIQQFLLYYFTNKHFNLSVQYANLYIIRRIVVFRGNDITK